MEVEELVGECRDRAICNFEILGQGAVGDPDGSDKHTAGDKRQAGTERLEFAIACFQIMGRGAGLAVFPNVLAAHGEQDDGARFADGKIVGSEYRSIHAGAWLMVIVSVMRTIAVPLF